MKHIFIFMLLISVAFSQQKIGEKESMDKSHIDFTKQYIFFTISLCR